MDATQEQVIGDDEVAGAVTAGHFCGTLPTGSGGNTGIFAIGAA